jgi:hypothetical protein
MPPTPAPSEAFPALILSTPAPPPAKTFIPVKIAEFVKALDNEEIAKPVPPLPGAFAFPKPPTLV